MIIPQLIILSFIAGAIGNIFANLIYFIVSKIKEWRISKKYYMIDDSEENLEPCMLAISNKKSEKENQNV